MKLKTKFVVIALVTLLNVVADQATKLWAVNSLKNTPSQSFLGDTFRLLYAENDGAFLSLGSDLPDAIRFALLTLLPIALLLGLGAYTLFSKEHERRHIIALSFVLGGGISNIYDRVLYGKVVDFMNMGIGSLRTGIFNIADISIMLGVGLLLFYSLTDKKAATP